MLFTELDKNIEQYESYFSDAGDLVKRRLTIGDKVQLDIYVSYIDMLADRGLIERQVITRLIDGKPELTNGFEDIADTLMNGMATADLSEKDNLEEIRDAVLSGDTVLFADGFDKALVISSKGWPNRGVPTTDTEPTVNSSKEAFSEVFRINTMLIRRRIRDSRLKVWQTVCGRRSKTSVALMYMEDVVRPSILEEAKKRLAKIDIDALAGAGALEQFIEDDHKSVFPQVQMTERPDKAASGILEGRIVIVIDNSPFVLLIPTTLNVLYQASDDYSERFYTASLLRIVRYIAGFLAIALPGIYLSVAIFHPDMLPMLMTFKMAAAREAVPLPAVFEILLMEAAFELLHEAGIRLPRAVGSSIGIIGGLIIGQAAVEAGLVSPIVVIVVAATEIAGFTIPNYGLFSGFRLSKYMITILSACLGFLGLWAGLIILIVHLSGIRSFGIPYLYPFSSGTVNDYSDFKDSIFRAPVSMMKKRPIFANPVETGRMKGD